MPGARPTAARVLLTSARTSLEVVRSRAAVVPWNRLVKQGRQFHPPLDGPHQAGDPRNSQEPYGQYKRECEDAILAAHPGDFASIASALKQVFIRTGWRIVENEDYVHDQRLAGGGALVPPLSARLAPLVRALPGT